MSQSEAMRVKPANWRRQVGKTQTELAEALGCSQSYVSQIERTANPIIPGPAVMIAYYELSDGLVQPNDFYALPALAASSRKAA